MKNNSKYTTGWIITLTSVVVGIMLTVVTATASITTRFNQNDADHTAITVDLKNQKKMISGEVNRSKSTDADITKSIKMIEINQEVMKNTLLQQQATLEKIERKLP